MNEVQSFFKDGQIKYQYRFSKGKIKLDSSVIDDASRDAIKAILNRLPEGKRTQEIVKCVLNTAIGLLEEQQVEM